MEALLALIKLFAALEPAVADALPAVEDIIAGKTVSPAQMVSVWTAVVALENLVAANAVQIEASANQGNG